MGIKLVINEFVVMMDLKKNLDIFLLYMIVVVIIFLIFFVNFSMVGMIYGMYNFMLLEGKLMIIGKNVWKLFVSGIVVLLLSVMIVGLFVW